jgi:DNA-binding protein HU-beta
VNKLELVAKIVKDTGLTKVGAAGAVESLLDGIRKSLKKGNSVTLVGFGTFQTSVRKARTARNPQTGATVKVPKRRVARFKAGKALKDAIN